MTRTQVSRLVVLMAFTLTLLAASAQADSISFDQNNLSGYAGQTITFSGSFAGDDVVGDGFQWGTLGSPCGVNPFSCINDDGFFNLLPGDHGDLFSIMIGNLTTLGTYNGKFQLTDGAGGPPLASADFTLTVTQVPEPGSLILLGTGLIGAAGAVRRRILS